MISFFTKVINTIQLGSPICFHTLNTVSSSHTSNMPTHTQISTLGSKHIFTTAQEVPPEKYSHM